MPCMQLQAAFSLNILFERRDIDNNSIWYKVYEKINLICVVHFFCHVCEIFMMNNVNIAAYKS
jgi:hypothetical protein